MLYLDHLFAGVGTPFVLRQSELRSPDLIVIVRDIDGALIDETMLPQAPRKQGDWPSVSLILDGAVLTQDFNTGGEREISRGAVVYSCDWRHRRIRILTPRTKVVSLVWRRGGPLSARDHGVTNSFEALPTKGIELAERFATTMREQIGEESSQREYALENLVWSLADAGLPLIAEGCATIRSWRAPELEPMATILQSVMAPLSNKPAAIDVANRLGCGERQALRRMNDYIQQMHVTVKSWRQYVFDIKLYVALLAMGNPKGKLGDVASWVGFSSATSLCHAFTTAQLPSPLEARSAITAKCEGLYRGDLLLSA